MMIDVKQLTKSYQTYRGATTVRAVDSISMHVEKGEFIGIMGPSGSGKTTLLNILAGIDYATSGEIVIDGQNITNLTKDNMAIFRREKVGYIFQDFNLLDSLTVRENIALPLILDKVVPQMIDAKLDPLLNFLRINDIQHNAPAQISGGQKQRVAAARALINNPAVIFADEPTGNLDSKSATNLMTMLAQLNEEWHNTILMVTHDAFSASFCKKIIFIKDGKIEMTITSNGERSQFFERILEVQSALSGGNV